MSQGLREIGNVQGRVDVDIVLIPGAGHPAVESWPFYSRQWLPSVLPASAKNFNLWTFDYKVPVDERFSFEYIWAQGERFLKALSESHRASSPRQQSEHQTHQQPIVFIAHSLGGAILKQAFCIADQQLYRYEYLVNRLAGIIFFSTPHLGSDQAETLDKALLALKATTKAAVKLPAKRMQEEGSILFDLSVRFESIRLRAPTLSVYEHKPTKIHEGLMKSRKLIIVDKATCTTQTHEEQFLPMPLDHAGVAQIKECGEDAKRPIRDFLAKAIKQAEDTVPARLEALEMRHWDTATYSPTYSETSAISFERIKNENSSARHDSVATVDLTNDATYGSSTAGFEALAHLVSNTSIREREPKLPCRILESEYRNPDFFGREDVLSKISTALLPAKDIMISSESEGLRQYALCGMGGLGKTEIASEFTFRHREAFDAVFWMRADDPSKLDTAFSRIAKQLNLEDPADSKNHIVSRELVKGWLSRPWKIAYVEGKPTPSPATWLLVFDNADDQVTLTDYWPLQCSGSVLLTSRDPLAKSFFTAQPSGLDLEPFSTEDGASLLKSMTLNAKDPEHIAERIAQSLGGLPLAISQMAGVIRRQDLRLPEFMESYEDASEQAELHKEKYAVGQSNYPYTVSTVWAFESLSKATSTLLGTLSLMDPDAIPELVFSDIPPQVELDAFPAKATAYRKARTELLQASLVKRHQDKNDLIIHRLVQDAFKAKMEPNDRSRTFWFAVSLIATRWPSTMPPPTKKDAPVVTPRMWMVDRWPMCEMLYPHAIKLKQYYERVGPEELGTPPLRFAALLQNAALWQFERGRTRELIQMLELALHICTLCDDPDKSSVFVDTHFALGAITAGTNDHDGSVFHHRCALDAQLETRQREDVLDVRLARCYNELGTGRMEAGDLKGSIEAFQESMSIDKQLGVYPYNWVMEANLGLSYTYSGNFKEAEEVLVGTLERREAKFGKDDTESYRPGRILHALARLREAQGKPQEAFELYTRSLKSLMATLGPHHHFTADCGHKVTQYAIKYQQYEEALKFIDQSLSFYKYEPQCFKAEIARTSYLHGKLMQLLGKDMRSRTLLKKAWALRRELVPAGTKPDAELELGDFDQLVSVMHSGTRRLHDPTRGIDKTLLDNLIGPSPQFLESPK